MFFAKTAVVAFVASALGVSAAGVNLSYKKCDASTGCSTIPTSLILEGGSKNLSAADFYEYGGNGVSMHTPGPVNRAYVVSTDGKRYEQFYLKNRQISIDVNLAGVGCGYNAAFYFAAMNTSAPLGSGYCDAQNTCNEMDVVEANIGSHSYAVHACSATTGACDPWGCGFNTYTRKYNASYGPGFFIDSTKTFTVTTAFYTDNKADDGTMNGVVQTISQAGKYISFPRTEESVCNDGKYWNSTGRLQDFSKAWDKGMTMIFSYWGGGPPDGMSWLDGGAKNNTACNARSGPPHAMFSNIVVDYIKAPTGTTIKV